MQRILKICLCAAFSFICNAGHSAEPVLNGMAVYSELGSEQFIAALYSENTTKDFKKMLLSNEDKRIELKVVANSIYSRRFKRMWIEGVAINAASAEMQKQAPNLATFSNLLKYRLKKNDLLTISRSTRKGVTLALNGVDLGTIPDPTFFDLILRTWIGAVPLSSDFRNLLLAAGTIDSDLLARYYSISASTERVAKIKSSLKPESEGVDLAAAVTNAPQIPGSETAAVVAATTAGGNTETPAEATTPGEETKTLASNTTPNPATDSSSEIEENQSVETQTSGADTTTKVDTASSTNTVAAVNNQVAQQPEQIIDDTIFDDEEEDFPVTAGSLLAEQLYISKVTRWTQKHIKYPRLSIKRNQQGTVRLSLEVSKSGEVNSLEVLAGSEHKSLNKAAVSAIKKASPFPAIPPELNRETYKITIPVIFQLK